MSANTAGGPSRDLPTLFTVGHSTHPLPRFLELLRAHAVNALADVRSKPFSRRNPQFNRERLRAALLGEGIEYVFLGKELGARSDEEGVYRDGRVDYALLAQTAAFRSGIDRLLAGSQRYRIALMCAEHEPLACHRTILIARHLSGRGVRIAHILRDGSLESHEAAMARLVRTLRLDDKDLFASPDELIAAAYDTQGSRIAFARD